MGREGNKRAKSSSLEREKKKIISSDKFGPRLLKRSARSAAVRGDAAWRKGLQKLRNAVGTPFSAARCSIGVLVHLRLGLPERGVF